ncbi:guanine nucleotide-binding protein-like 3 homolog [Corticium candelabrum]|uniref:guanine nucleotide-binding protein-like 3 homolog n=1 Tax=Corticium candelabrum TaxID=121492 RepID=UPI002E2676F3|nr:guanine nucleotide-binding protein-like 3 homolog [Corticium candelabrum]
MVRPKKKSKRVPARKRYKIEKKVREHNRKERKRSKSKTGKTKKDPGIPNLFPFKDQILKQAEEKKRRLEEVKQRQKEQRKKEHAKRRKLGSLQNLQKDAARRSADFEKKMTSSSSPQMYSLPAAGSNTTDGSRHAYVKEFKKVVDAADVILEVLDARDPLGCRCPQVEEAVFASGPNKRLVLLLNKIDLVPSDNVKDWLKYLRHEYPTVAFKASTQQQRQNLSQSKVSTSLASSDLLASSRCLGADTLMKLLSNYCRNAGVKTAIRVGIVGFPNVGKSSVINSLKRSRACMVGAIPGVTKAMQEVHLDKHVKLLDCPGIVMASGKGLDQATAVLRNCIKVEDVVDPVSPVEVIIQRCQRDQVMEQYGIPEYGDVGEFLSHLALRKGKLRKGGIPDMAAAARSLLQDWNSGRFRFYTHPPETQVEVSARVVAEWGKCFDMASLEMEEQEMVLGDIEQSGESTGLLMESGHALEAASPDAVNSEEMVVKSDSDSAPELIDLSQVNMVVAIRDVKRKAPSASRKRVQYGMSKEALNPQTNKLVKEALKARKRRNKKFQRVVDDLEVGTSGLSLSSPTAARTDSDSDYDFEKDFQL